MLIVKLIEAIVRIVGGAGFDRSRHVIDSGLLGVIGLVGCCGLRARSKDRRRKSRRMTNGKPGQGVPPNKRTDMASYNSPHSELNLAGLPGPGFIGTGQDSRKGSTHSGPPPSVLRPEHALPRPYREDDDDEGYIMGAWQAYPLRHGYVPVVEQNTAPPPPKSGFSRIGGGKSHIDTPYAIMDGTGSAFAHPNSSMQAIAPSSMIGNGSTHTFPSVTQQNQSRTTLPQHGLMGSTTNTNVFYDDDDPPPSLSSVARQPEYGQLPPGAMQPAHVRTKSQTAIIEDASKLYGHAALTAISANSGNSAGPSNNIPGSSGWPNTTGIHQTRFSVVADDDNIDGEDDDSTVEEQPKKKPWYRIIRHRPNSSDGPSSSAPAPQPLLPPPSSFSVDPELGGLGTPGSGISSGAASGSSGSNGSGGSGGTQQPARSFVVIRKPQP